MRNWQLLSIPADLLLAFMQQPRQVRLIFDPPLPADVTVHSVQAEWAQNAVAFLLASTEWPEVPLGQEPPRLYPIITYETPEEEPAGLRQG